MIKNFIKSVVTAIKGEDAETKAKKIQRRASGTFKTQITGLEATTMDHEEAIEEAEEKVLKSLINNGEDIDDRDAYLDNYLKAVEEKEAAEATLEQHKKTIQVLKAGLEMVQSKEEIEE